MTRRRHPAIALLLVALACVAPAPRAAAQAGLPPEITRATTLTDPQKQTIREYVAEAFKHFAAEAPADVRAEVRRGKYDLLSPLGGRDVSVAFRQEYSQDVVPQLQPLAAHADDFRRVNALIVAGELATGDALSLVERALADPQTSVRSAACYAMARTFDAVAVASPAVFSDRLVGLTTKLAEVVRKEQDPHVVLSAITALERALGVDRNGMEGVRSAGLAAMGTAVRDRAKAAAAGGKVPQLLLQALTNAGQAARVALTQNDPRLALSPEGVKQVAELNGHLLALVVVRMQAGDFPAGDTGARDLPAQAVSVAETTLGVAGQKASPPVTLPGGLANEFKKATPEGDTRFLRGALEMFRTLHQPPFGFPGGTFLKGDDKPQP